jgi:hypothetical protein
MPIIKKLILQVLRPFASIFHQQELRNSTNLRLILQKRAANSTAAYIEDNMLHVASFRGQKDVLDKAISKVTIDGLNCEFGVASGDTLNHLKKKTSKIFHGFDSFKGLPEFWRDGWDKNAFEMAKVPKINGNVKIHVGYFEDSLPKFLSDYSEPFAFVHIDCDLYSATRSIFTLARDRFVSGTVISFDEYFNYSGWQYGEFKAFQEFIKESGMAYEYVTYNSKQSQVAVVLK